MCISVRRYNRISSNSVCMPGQLTGQPYADKEVIVSDAESKFSERSLERRRKPRICVPFHATVRGMNNEGERFKVETVMDNVSGAGLYMRMMPGVKEGTRLSIALRLHTGSAMNQEAPRVLVEGVVLRAESKAGGVCGVAVEFDQVRFA